MTIFQPNVWKHLSSSSPFRTDVPSCFHAFQHYAAFVGECWKTLKQIKTLTWHQLNFASSEQSLGQRTNSHCLRKVEENLSNYSDFGKVCWPEKSWQFGNVFIVSLLTAKLPFNFFYSIFSIFWKFLYLHFNICLPLKVFKPKIVSTL